MAMNEIYILNRMYKNEAIRLQLYFFYKDKSRLKEVTRTGWNDLIAKNHIENCIEQLFHFFDSMRIFIAIVPSERVELWSYRIFTGESISIDGSFYTRSDATIAALYKAISMLDEKNKKEHDSKEEG
jgi:hypothetical protein